MNSTVRHARIQSILRKAGEKRPVAHPELALEPAERMLALHLDQVGDAIAGAAAAYAPNLLAAYLHELASLYTTFYDQCPVLKAATPEAVENRLFLCEGMEQMHDASSGSLAERCSRASFAA